MASPTLAELTKAAASSDGPSFPPANVAKLGGVDPLGLRQINFDLMDSVLPGLNNIARHIRPFVVIAWAWRRASDVAQSQGLKTVSLDLIQDFVDRIEVIFVWSQLLKNSEADLPGRQILVPLLNAPIWTFGGTDWEARKRSRRYSTALSAPINYGPGLKMLGWVQRHPQYPDILVPTDTVTLALDAFEVQIAKHLGHPAFSAFGSVTVTKAEARAWADDWSLGVVTEAEARAVSEMLFGAVAPKCRQLAGEMILDYIDHSSTSDADRIRRDMAGPPSGFVPSQHLQETWQDFRRLQVRQLFRLSLESLFYWVLGFLNEKPKSMEAIIDGFLAELSPTVKGQKAGEWLHGMISSEAKPVELMDEIRTAMSDSASKGPASAICAALAFCLGEKDEEHNCFQSRDRLPLSVARKEAAVRADDTVDAFLRHVMESWVFAQHVYWSIGRGLADARARSERTILRLRVILDEGGWTLSPGAGRGSPPVPTADRLETLLSLARESGLL